MSDSNEILNLLGQAKIVAQKYRALTGKPLGITGEVAEFEAAHLLGLTLSDARQSGYDATEVRSGHTWKIQIKGRCVTSTSAMGRLGSIDVTKEFDAVMLVLLDFNFNAIAIYEAPRDKVISRIAEPGSKARNVRGSLRIQQFKSIATLRWKRTEPAKPACG
ncbi:DUF6998 domain-containing protein [Pseudomonas sp. PDM25]|uniref:DUF6998 domain-containing protein n=1 Tax=Pseudomonas sp. PDM25 TaxID=2854772 RepID=UPI00211076AF|nr:hypothetical protein [Pseudomonas sp. PDM25]